MPRVCVDRSSMNARVRIGGRVHWLGKCPDGKVTAEQQARAARLWHEHLSGVITPQGEVVAVEVTPQVAVIEPRTAPMPAGSITVAQIGLRYLDHCQTYYRTPDGKVTSSVAGVEMALRALFPFSDTPAATFGPRALKVVRDALVRDGRPRVTCNRVVKTIRRMFKWVASEELVSSEAWHALETVAALQKGRTEAPELEPVDEVPEPVVAETLPHLPPVVAAMVQFQRWTGTRPGEVCLLRPCDIDRTGAVWVYRPEHHKLSWREDAMPRQITIGVEGQKVLMPFLLRAASASSRRSSICGTSAWEGSRRAAAAWHHACRRRSGLRSTAATGPKPSGSGKSSCRWNRSATPSAPSACCTMPSGPPRSPPPAHSCRCSTRSSGSTTR